MIKSHLVSLIRFVILILTVGTFVEMALPATADARIGGGRSIGRPSGFGSRPSQSARPYSNDRYDSSPQGQPPARSGGGFMRGAAGGLAGGFLGSMLFSSLGLGAGYGGNGGGGGMGLVEIILLGGLAYWGFRWWKNRQQAVIGKVDMPRTGNGEFSTMNRTPFASETSESSMAKGIDAELASDIFFKVQGAWTRRDVTPVRQLLGRDIQQILDADLAALKADHTINRLENIAVRRAEVTHSWQERGLDYSTVRFLANLLDYTVDEKTQQVVAGNAEVPVKFEEDWTFEKEPNAPTWQLVGIQQV